MLINYTDRFTGEIIQQGYIFTRGHVIFCLCRYLQIPEVLREKDAFNNLTPNVFLPPFDGLMPFDSENKWILTARVVVANGKDLETMDQALADLATVKTELEGCFDFQAVDRHTFDTRVRT